MVVIDPLWTTAERHQRLVTKIVNSQNFVDSMQNTKIQDSVIGCDDKELVL